MSLNLDAKIIGYDDFTVGQAVEALADQMRFALVGTDGRFNIVGASRVDDSPESIWLDLDDAETGHEFSAVIEIRGIHLENLYADAVDDEGDE